MMDTQANQFPQRSRKALTDEALQNALSHLQRGFVVARRNAQRGLPEFDQLRDAAATIKDHVLAHLGHYLRQFESQVRAAGGQVHWARDAAEARAIILDLCRQADARTITKSKSMVTEEIDLNAALEEAGLQPVETDLGEYIIQLRHERPSHIVAPAIHLRKEQVSETFAEAHAPLGFNAKQTERSALVREARQVLRRRFISADVGITGANFLIADKGQIALVTNEGNADLTATLPRMHIAVAGIEKIVPDRDALSLFLRLLIRSATGQEITSYVSLYGGRGTDLSANENFHVVLLDNGRTDMLGTDFEPMLRCIRCGACLNHCPVYGAVGGHAYGSVYPGPMGAVLTPALAGLDQANSLPNASTFCGRCEEVCPVRIPLPAMLRAWRQREQQQGGTSAVQRFGLWFWSILARSPFLYRVTVWKGRTALRLFSRDGWIKRLPFVGGWTGTRDIPSPGDMS